MPVIVVIMAALVYSSLLFLLFLCRVAIFIIQVLFEVVISVCRAIFTSHRR